jgi:hypothetical protein
VFVAPEEMLDLRCARNRVHLSLAFTSSRLPAASTPSCAPPAPAACACFTCRVMTNPPAPPPLSLRANPWLPPARSPTFLCKTCERIFESRPPTLSAPAAFAPPDREGLLLGAGEWGWGVNASIITRLLMRERDAGLSPSCFRRSRSAAHRMGGGEGGALSSRDHSNQAERVGGGLAG